MLRNRCPSASGIGAQVVPERAPKCRRNTPAIEHPLLRSQNPVGLPEVVLARVMVIGPPWVVNWTFVGRMMGKLSPTASPVVIPDRPIKMIFVPAGGDAGMTCIARVIVLNAQPGAAVEPERPLPAAVRSLPLIGSTKYRFPVTVSH